ncbi:MAG: hypothetical protein WCI01_00615 [Chlorobiaceae bacterium]
MLPSCSSASRIAWLGVAAVSAVQDKLEKLFLRVAPSCPKQYDKIYYFAAL